MPIQHPESRLLTSAWWVLLLTTALIPVIILPTTLEVLEISKHMVLYSGVLIALMLVGVDAAMQRRFVYRKHPFFMGMLAVAGATILSGLFSLDRMMSFVGDYNMLQVGVLPLLFLCIGGMLVAHLATTPRRVMTLVMTGVMSLTLAALSFLTRSFTHLDTYLKSLGVTNIVALSTAEFAYLLVSIAIGCGVYLLFKRRSYLPDIAASVIGLLSLITAVSIGFTSVYVLLAIGLLLVLGIGIAHASTLRMSLVTTYFGILITTLLFIFLGAPSFTQTTLPSEVSLGIRESASVSWDTVTSGIKPFLFGSGPATFVYDYSRFRPQYINNNSFAWQLRFSKPQSTAFSIFAETGFVGVIAYGFLLLVVLGFSGTLWMSLRGTVREHPLVPFTVGLTLGWTLIMVSLFLGSAGIVTHFLLWMGLVAIGILCTMITEGETPHTAWSLKSSPHYVLATSFGMVLLLALGVVYGVYAGRFYVAEMYYTQAVMGKASSGDALKLFAQAVSYNNQNPRYYLGLAQSYLAEAQRISADPSAPADVVTSLIAQAVNNAKLATQIAPNNAQTWELLVSMYATARTFAPSVDQWMLDALQRSVELEPQNPVSRVRLAYLLFNQGKKSEAKDQLLESLRLKPDYLEGIIGLAQVYEAENNLDTAITEMEQGMSLGGQQDSVYLFHLGRLLFNRNKTDDWKNSEIVLQASINLNPNNVNALYSLAVLYDKQGKTRDSLDLYKKTQKLDPHNETVNRRIKQLSIASS